MSRVPSLLKSVSVVTGSGVSPSKGNLDSKAGSELGFLAEQSSCSQNRAVAVGDGEEASIDSAAFPKVGWLVNKCVQMSGQALCSFSLFPQPSSGQGRPGHSLLELQMRKLQAVFCPRVGTNSLSAAQCFSSFVIDLIISIQSWESAPVWDPRRMASL